MVHFSTFRHTGNTMKPILTILLTFTPLLAAEYTITPETVSSLKKICKKVLPGDKVYFKGGEYRSPFPHITCSGSVKGDVTLTAYPGERVRIRSSIVIKANYLRIEKLHFKGNNENLSYNEVISQWWRPSKAIRKGGLLIEGHHITLKDNAIGLYPASGVKFKGKSDYLTIDHNIIYNNAWWSTGGTGGLIVKNIHQIDSSKATKVRITNNLFFGNESRIVSHVFKKGFCTMTIDEGESFLIQQKDDPTKKGAQSGHYEGRYLVENNLILFNGKGTSLNKAEHIDVVANTLYCNGTTARNTSAAGIRGNRTNHDTFIDNAVETCRNGLAFSIVGKDNRFANNFAKSANPKPIPGVTYVDTLFHNPKQLDFFTSAFGNRANRLLESFKPMLLRHGIEVKPTGYRVDLEKQIATIVASIPKTDKTTIRRYPDRIVIDHIDNRNIRDLPDTFELRLK